MGDASDTAGHRARLRGRLLKDCDGLLDYELIEYLLMLALPRIDTKPLAKAVINEFGGLAHLLTADAGSLKRVPGLGDSGAAALKIVQATASRMLQARIRGSAVLGSWQALLDYLQVEMANRATEQVRVLHLDGKNVLIRDEAMWDGTIDQASVHIREVIRRALELGSASIILVHNHPSGDPQPSRADIQLTRDIVEAGKRLGIAVHDHIIVGAQGHSSLRAMGLL